MQELRVFLTKTKAELKEERDKVIELEDYTRRENLKFHNIPEPEVEGVNHSPKQVILSNLQMEVQMDTAQVRFHAVYRIGKPQIRFHAVHRIGKRKENKQRPTIARFVCREDRDQIFTRKKGIKESTKLKDTYITTDYAKAIQDERRKLIKAMFKAKEQGSEAKVVGRYLYIGELKYDGKLYLWDCRRKQILPNIYGFRAKIVAKYETEEKISNKELLKRKWILTPYLS